MPQSSQSLRQSTGLPGRSSYPRCCWEAYPKHHRYPPESCCRQDITACQKKVETFDTNVPEQDTMRCRACRMRNTDLPVWPIKGAPGRSGSSQSAARTALQPPATDASPCCAYLRLTESTTYPVPGVLALAFRQYQRALAEISAF